MQIFRCSLLGGTIHAVLGTVIPLIRLRRRPKSACRKLLGISALGTCLMLALSAAPSVAMEQLSQHTEFQVTVRGSTQPAVWDAIKQLELGHDRGGWYLRIAGANGDARGYSVTRCKLKGANPAVLFEIQRSILALIPYAGVVSVRCGDAEPNGTDAPLVDLDDTRPGAATFYVVFGPK